MQSRAATCFVFLLVTLWTCGCALADPAPLQPHRAEYLLTRDGLPIATMVMELNLSEDGRYHYHARTRPHKALALVGKALEISPGARVDETSSGGMADGRFRPDHYRYQRENESRRELTIRFDWKQGRADIESADKPWSMEVPENALDKLAVLLALRQDLALGEKDFSYPVADGGKLKSYRYVVTDQAQITTAAGTWESAEVTRSKQGGPTDYRLWLAPDLKYLPILIERDEKGARFSMELTGIETPGQ